MKRDNYNIFGQWEFPENEALKLVEKEMVKLGSQGMTVHPLGRIQTFQGEGIACAMTPR